MIKDYNKGVSIVLCTYNGKQRLETTLKHIATQKLTVPCEIIFVDNASTDGTKAFADSWWQTHGNSNITYLLDNTLFNFFGIVFALMLLNVQNSS